MMKYKVAAALVGTLALVPVQISAHHHEPRKNAAQPRFSLAMPIEQLVANPAARQVLERHMPGLVNSGQFPSIKHLSLQQLSRNPRARISAEKLRALQSGLAALR